MKKILIIEDENDLRLALQTRLIGDGYLVKTSETAEEGLKNATEETPDLILLDVMTNSLHASVFLERLRNFSEKTRSIKVIVLTNLDNDITRQKVSMFGIEAYLIKSNTSLEKVSEIIAGILS